jgi:hypothetical protein
MSGSLYCDKIGCLNKPMTNNHVCLECFLLDKIESLIKPMKCLLLDKIESLEKIVEKLETDIKEIKKVVVKDGAFRKSIRFLCSFKLRTNCLWPFTCRRWGYSQK